VIIMGRRKQTIDDLDPDLNADGTAKARVYNLYILNPMEGMGIAYDDGAFITFTTKIVNGVEEHYTNGYHTSLVKALEELYKHVLQIRVIKKTRLKKEALELSEIRDLILKTNKEFEKLWVKLPKEQQHY